MFILDLQKISISKKISRSNFVDWGNHPVTCAHRARLWFLGVFPIWREQILKVFVEVMLEPSWHCKRYMKVVKKSQIFRDDLWTLSIYFWRLGISCGLVAQTTQEVCPKFYAIVSFALVRFGMNPNSSTTNLTRRCNLNTTYYLNKLLTMQVEWNENIKYDFYTSKNW